VRLDDVQGFVFDVDGTLVHRGPDGRGRPLPGAVEILDAIRASGRRFVLFTNGSHVPAWELARGLREDGLPLNDDEVITPVESALTYLRRHHDGKPVMLFATPATRERMAAAGVPLTDEDDARVVLVTHVDGMVDLAQMERAARAVTRGAPLLTGSYVAGYMGANGLIFSRGAMITAGIAKVSETRPKVVGKPSRVAVEEMRTYFGLPATKLAVIGDDVALDIRLGRMGGSKTVLVRTGTTGDIDIETVPEGQRPDLFVHGVDDLLELL